MRVWHPLLSRGRRALGTGASIVCSWIFSHAEAVVVNVLHLHKKKRNVFSLSLLKKLFARNPLIDQSGTVHAVALLAVVLQLLEVMTGISERRGECRALQSILFRTISLVSVEIDALESLKPAGKQPLQSRKYHDFGYMQQTRSGHLPAHVVEALVHHVASAVPRALQACGLEHLVLHHSRHCPTSDAASWPRLNRPSGSWSFRASSAG